MKKLNQTGTAHLIVGLFVVAIIGAIGTILLRQSHAAPAGCSVSKNYAIISNSGEGAQADIKTYAYVTSAGTCISVGGKSAGSYVNTITPVTVVSPSAQWSFCGYPQGSYAKTKLYTKNSSGQFVAMFPATSTGYYGVVNPGNSLCRSYTTKTNLCNQFYKVTLQVSSSNTISAYVTGCSLIKTVITGSS
jgi:hypothetical protein